MKIRNLEYELLNKKYTVLKELWHAKINYLRTYKENGYHSFMHRAWLRIYIMQLKREMEEILFKMGKLRRHVPCDWCASRFDREV